MQQQQQQHDDYSNQLANMAAMDYRYDLQASSSNQYLASPAAMYPTYGNNDIHLYSYGANGGGAEPQSSDLYPYYNEGNVMYPSLRAHYGTTHSMAEGQATFHFINQMSNISRFLHKLSCRISFNFSNIISLELQRNQSLTLGLVNCLELTY